MSTQSLSEILAGAPTTLTLEQFLGQADALNLAERELLVDQALILIDQLYVHLPLKRAMHAVNPVQRLKLLRLRLAPLSERQFHDEMLSIFTELRDLHTSYALPTPYQSQLAYLPFLIEEYFEGKIDTHPRYLVTKLTDGFTHQMFDRGAELTHWNGVPFERAVELNAAQQAGSNLEARRARGLDAMTIRPMGMSAPPEELWVDVRYVPPTGGEPQEVRLHWRVFALLPSPDSVDPNNESDPATRYLAYDARTEAVRRAKKVLFNRRAMNAEWTAASRRASVGSLASVVTDLTSVFPEFVTAKAITTPNGTFGYLRLWTFMVSDVDSYLREVIRLLDLLPQNGLILDVRGNGGGNLIAAESVLQFFTPNRVQPTLLSFINTPLTLQLCENGEQLELSSWSNSIRQAVEIGSDYSQGFPTRPEQIYNTFGQQYQGPAVLITDALCYSATDAFAAGFEDNGIGLILGTSGNTGAGGANVWEHAQLLQNFPTSAFPFKPLPKKAGFRVALRRMTRRGAKAGTPIEDLGVVPNRRHFMTKMDITSSNEDMLAAAGRLLVEQPVRRLRATVNTAGDGQGSLVFSTLGLNRVDVSLKGRPLISIDVQDGENQIAQPAISDRLDLAGYANGKLAVMTHIDLTAKILS